jgi:hypothetical protein
MSWRDSAFRILAFLVACNYFAFRAELFRDEDAQSHPQQRTGLTISVPTLNWETFDKDNASTAFAADGHIQIELIGLSPQDDRHVFRLHPQFQLVRDKSPPTSSRGL